MFRKTVAVSLALGGLLFTQASASVASPAAFVQQATRYVWDGSKTQSAAMVTIQTKNAHIHVSPAIANNHFGSTAPLSKIAAANHAVAAINGSFFNVGGDNKPSGTVVINGQFERSGDGSILGIRRDGSLFMGRFTESTQLTIGNNGSTPVYPWHLNSWNGNPAEIDILTPLYGSTTDVNNVTSVVVEQNRITEIQRGSVKIPTDGFVVVMGDVPYNQRLLAAMQIGDPLNYRVVLSNANGNPVDTSTLVSAIGAGPLLVDHGKVVLNPAVEHLNSPSLVNPVTRRSMVGIDTKGNLVFVTVKNANLNQLAKIAVWMHLQEAMNLDGGSSSGLTYQGHDLMTPGRSLADALVVTYH